MIKEVNFVTERIRTSHDLGHLLESWAKVLLSLPEISVLELADTNQGEGVPKRWSSNDGVLTPDLKQLAGRLPEIERDRAHAELSGLTVKQIKAISTFLHIRTPSKIAKAEVIDMLLRHLFDIPAGQEVVRTFTNVNR